MNEEPSNKKVERLTFSNIGEVSRGSGFSEDYLAEIVRKEDKKNCIVFVRYCFGEIQKQTFHKDDVKALRPGVDLAKIMERPKEWEGVFVWEIGNIEDV